MLAIKTLRLVNTEYLTAFEAFRTFVLRLSSPMQPGHGFLSLMYAMQRRQFIPQGAISFVEIVALSVDLSDVISISRRGYVSPSLLSRLLAFFNKPKR